MMTRFVILTFVTVTMLAPLSACGKKGKLDRPGLAFSQFDGGAQ